jgi:hypothetical protein
MIPSPVKRSSIPRCSVTSRPTASWVPAQDEHDVVRVRRFDAQSRHRYGRYRIVNDSDLR